MQGIPDLVALFRQRSRRTGIIPGKVIGPQAPGPGIQIEVIGIQCPYRIVLFNPVGLSLNSIYQHVIQFFIRTDKIDKLQGTFRILGRIRNCHGILHGRKFFIILYHVVKPPVPIRMTLILGNPVVQTVGAGSSLAGGHHIAVLVGKGSFRPVSLFAPFVHHLQHVRRAFPARFVEHNRLFGIQIHPVNGFCIPGQRVKAVIHIVDIINLTAAGIYVCRLHGRLVVHNRLHIGGIVVKGPDLRQIVFLHQVSPDNHPKCVIGGLARRNCVNMIIDHSRFLIDI